MKDAMLLPQLITSLILLLVPLQIGAQIEIASQSSTASWSDTLYDNLYAGAPYEYSSHPKQLALEKKESSDNNR